MKLINTDTGAHIDFGDTPPSNEDQVLFKKAMEHHGPELNECINKVARRNDITKIQATRLFFKVKDQYDKPWYVRGE